MSNRFVFVHIPKTAGTSFRKGIEGIIGKDAMFYDYGIESKARNETLVNYLYNQEVPDMFGFRSEIDNYHDAVVCGHFQAKKFFPYFSFGQMGAFFREPVARTISEYLHFKRIIGYKGTIEQFCENPIFQNRQCFFMNSVDLNDLGFIGITEKYQESLQDFYDLTGIDVPYMDINKANQYPDEITPAVFEYAKQFNEKDTELYNTALQIFDQRREATQLKRSEHAYSSSIRLIKENRIQGWALANDRPESSPFYYLILSGVVVKKFKANDYRLDLKNRKICRSGSVGFSFNIDANTLVKGNVFILSTSESPDDEINRLKIP